MAIENEYSYKQSAPQLGKTESVLLGSLGKAPLGFKAREYPRWLSSLPSEILAVSHPSFIMKDRFYLQLSSNPASCQENLGMLRVSFYFVLFLSLTVSVGSTPADKIFPSTLWLYVAFHIKAHPQTFLLR